MEDADPWAARAGWNLTAERVAKSPEGLDIPGLHLDLIEYIAPKGAPTAGPPNDVGNVHIGFTVDDMWAAYNALVAAGVEFKCEPVSPTAGPNKGGWAVYFTDPDGTTLEMIQKPKPDA